MTRKMRVYVASSFRNRHQPEVVKMLRDPAFEFDTYDFREDGFSWRSIDCDWEKWSPRQYRAALKDPVAIQGYDRDMLALRQADLCILVLPAGRSASFEAGYHFGQKDRAGVIYMPESCEPDLMYRELGICTNKEELFDSIAEEAHEWAIGLASRLAPSYKREEIERAFDHISTPSWKAVSDPRIFGSLFPPRSEMVSVSAILASLKLLPRERQIEICSVALRDALGIDVMVGIQSRFEEALAEKDKR